MKIEESKKVADLVTKEKLEFIRSIRICLTGGHYEENEVYRDEDGYYINIVHTMDDKGFTTIKRVKSEQPLITDRAAVYINDKRCTLMKADEKVKIKDKNNKQCTLEKIHEEAKSENNKSIMKYLINILWGVAKYVLVIVASVLIIKYHP